MSIGSSSMKRSVCRFRCSGNPCSVYYFLLPLLLFLIVPAGCYRIDDTISTTTMPIDTTTILPIFTTTATNNVGNIAFIVGGVIVGDVIASVVVGCIAAAIYYNSGGGSYNPVVRTGRWVQGWTYVEDERLEPN